MAYYLYTSSIEVSGRVYWAWVAYEQDEERTLQYTEPLDAGTTLEEAHLQAIGDALGSAARPQTTLRLHDAELVAWLSGQTEAPPDLAPQVGDIRSVLHQEDIRVEAIAREQNPAWTQCVKASDEHAQDLRDYADVLRRDSARVLEWIQEWELMEFTLCQLFDGISQEELELQDAIDPRELMWKLRELRDGIALFMEDYGEER